MRTSLVIAASAAVFDGCGAAIAQDYDFQWTTIGNPGNAPYVSSSPDDLNVNGRGSVNYEYRASRLEITTAQWMEFLNAFAPLNESPLDHRGPLLWGAFRDDQLPNGHYVMSLDPIRSQAAMLPVGGLSWRDAARYCNWLHNGKQVSIAAISTGAYDTSTWGGGPGNYTDDPHRMPGARFFLPEYSEYIKAVHYDPNRFGPNQGGYWQYKTRSDTPPIPGAPGVGQTDAGYLPGGNPFAAWSIPLGAYADVQTAYGLFDTSGGAQEWIEGFTEQTSVHGRAWGGSYGAMDPGAISYVDRIGWASGSNVVDFNEPFTSFRVYSTVPSPGVAAFVCMGVALAYHRRRLR